MANPNIAVAGQKYRWTKGQSGNPAGRPKSKTLSEALKQLLSEETDETTTADKLAEIVLEKAMDGDLEAAKMIADRTEGKPRQSIEHGTTDGQPLFKVYLGIDADKV